MTENRPIRPDFAGKSQTNSAIGGDTTIAPQVVFSLVRAAALSTYGVVGIASRYTGHDSTQRDPHRGLEVTLLSPDPATGECKRVKVDIHIIIEYGVRIPAVTTSLQHQIQYIVEHSTGFCVEEIHIHVDAMRVTEDTSHVP